MAMTLMSPQRGTPRALLAIKLSTYVPRVGLRLAEGRTNKHAEKNAEQQVTNDKDECSAGQRACQQSE